MSYIHELSHREESHVDLMVGEGIRWCRCNRSRGSGRFAFVSACEYRRTLKVPDVCPSSLLEKAGDTLNFSMTAGEWLNCYEDQVCAEGYFVQASRALSNWDVRCAQSREVRRRSYARRFGRPLVIVSTVLKYPSLKYPKESRAIIFVVAHDFSKLAFCRRRRSMQSPRYSS